MIESGIFHRLLVDDSLCQLYMHVSINFAVTNYVHGTCFFLKLLLNALVG